MKESIILKKIVDNQFIEKSKIIYPFVTVIITSYNYERYIISCLKSVERQNYPNYKCIIVDDCSTDNSVEKIDEFINNTDSKNKFTLIQHNKNGGQMSAFKTGLNAADGVFIVYVDADDILFDDFLTTHIQHHLTSMISIAFTSSNQLQIDENNQILYCNHPDLSTYGKLRLIDSNILLDGPWIWATTSSMMFRKAVLEMIIPDETDHFRICADAYISRFANMIGGSLLVPTVHGCYRKHGANNFSKNPFIGGILPTGDVRSHPTYNVMKDLIISHIAINREKFVEVLTKAGVLKILWILINQPFEINKLVKKYPELFDNRSKLFTLKLMLIFCPSIFVKNLCKKFKRFIKKPRDSLMKLIL